MAALVFVIILISGLVLIYIFDRQKQRDMERKRFPRAEQPPRNWKQSIIKKEHQN